MEIDSSDCAIYEADLKFARLEKKRSLPLDKLTLEAFSLTGENVDYWMANMDCLTWGSLIFAPSTSLLTPITKV